MQYHTQLLELSVESLLRVERMEVCAVRTPVADEATVCQQANNYDVTRGRDTEFVERHVRPDESSRREIGRSARQHESARAIGDGPPLPGGSQLCKRHVVNRKGDRPFSNPRPLFGIYALPGILRASSESASR